MSRNPPHRPPSPSSPTRRRPRARKAPRRPSLEALEDRTVPAHFTPNLPNFSLLNLVNLVNQTVHSFAHTPSHQAGVHSSGGVQTPGSPRGGGPGPKATRATFPGPAANPTTTSVSPLLADPATKAVGVAGAGFVGPPAEAVTAGVSVHPPGGAAPTAGQGGPIVLNSGGGAATGDPATPGDRAGGVSTGPSDWLAAAPDTPPALGVRLSGGTGACLAPAEARFAGTLRVTGEGPGPALLASFTQGGDTLDDLADEQIQDLLASEPGPDPAWAAEPLSALDLSVALLTGGRPRADILPPAGSRVNPVVTLLGREEGVDKIGDEPAPGGERISPDLLIRAPGVGREEERAVASATGPQTPPPPPGARRFVHAVALTAALLFGLALCARRDRGRAEPRCRPACRRASNLPGLPGRAQAAPSA